MTINHETFIRECYRLARLAREQGNHPFGALLAHNGRPLLSAKNSVNSDQDVTRHAELNLVSQASQQFSADRLAESILYTSTEPCAMCAGAIFWAGIRTVIYGCGAGAVGRLASGRFVVPSRDIYAYATEPVTVIGPVLEEEGLTVHQGFWR